MSEEREYGYETWSAASSGEPTFLGAMVYTPWPIKRTWRQRLAFWRPRQRVWLTGFDHVASEGKDGTLTEVKRFGKPKCYPLDRHGYATLDIAGRPRWFWRLLRPLERSSPANAERGE